MPRKKVVKDDSPTVQPEAEKKPAAAKTAKPRAKAASVKEPAPKVAEPKPTPAKKTAANASKKPVAAKVKPEPDSPFEAPAPAASKKPLFGKKSVTPAAVVSVEVKPEVVAKAEPEAREQKRNRGLRSQRPEPELVVAAPVEEAKAEPKGRGRRTRPERKPQPQVQELDEFGYELPMPTWRSREAASASAAPAAPAEAEPNLAPRRSRRGRRGEPEQEITAAAALAPPAEPQERRGRGRREDRKEPKPVEAVQPEPEPLKTPAKPLIPIPAEAPQVVLREGVPTLVRDKRVYPPLMFFGSSLDEKRMATVMDEVRMAGEAGIHLHQFLVDFEVDRDAVDSAVQFAAYLLTQALKADPEAQVLFRIVFVATKGWQERYPDARYNTSDGALAEPSICDDAFWNTAQECLEVFVKKLRLLQQKDHVLGVHLERGEWFMAAGWGYDTSRAAKVKFRDWARVRYHNDVVALRAAWFDGDANFDSLDVPEYRPSGQAGQKFVRADRKERKWVDYHLFLSDATVQRIGDLAYAVKEASEGYFLVCTSYGYTFEWSHPASGHLSLGKLLRTPEIDVIAGPPSYKSREPGGAAPFPGPVDSYALNGKLYISEEDFKTAIGQGQEPDDFNPMIKTPQALESMHWRGVGSALAHAAGICWMDLWGNGWLKTPNIWQRGSAVGRTLINRMAAPQSAPDVALFVDERALAYLVDEKAFSLLVQNVRESVLRSGLSAGFYLLSDLAHRESFPESKLYIFLNAWDIRSDLRAAIKSRLQRDDKVLFWLYAAGLFDSGRETLERAREVTGIALKPQPFHSKSGTTILNRRHPLYEAFPDRGVAANIQLDPSYFAIPEEAQVLGEYSQTGLPSFVIKESGADGDASNRWTSVFLGEPVVTPALVRTLGHMAGAHVWNYQEDVVHCRPPFLTVHCTGSGPRTIALPGKWSAYNLLTQEWIQTDSMNVRFNAIDGSTHAFLVGVREELETLLNADPADLLRMEELPAKPDDTTRFDVDAFDVPMMKLGEWIEGASDDELNDDILLRPHLAVEEVDQQMEEKSGRRRRRRGRRGDRNGGEEGAPGHRENSPPRDFDDDLGMSVVFRKRE